MAGMDRKWRWGLAACLVGLFVVAAGAPVGQAAANMARKLASPTSTAVVDIAQVLEKLDEKRTREQELEREITRWQENLDKLKNKADVFAADLDALVPGSQSFLEVQEQAIRAEAQLRVEKEIADRRLQQSRMRMQLELYNKIMDAAGRYADREGFDVVFSSDVGEEIPDEAVDRMEPQAFMAMLASRRIVHASNAVDITEGVALLMNNEFQAP